MQKRVLRRMAILMATKLGGCVDTTGRSAAVTTVGISYACVTGGSANSSYAWKTCPVRSRLSDIVNIPAYDRIRSGGQR